VASHSSVKSSGFALSEPRLIFQSCSLHMMESGWASSQNCCHAPDEVITTKWSHCTFESFMAWCMMLESTATRLSAFNLC